MNKYNFDVTIAFINVPHYKTTVGAINCYQATQQALKEHRIKTNCSASEMYDSRKSTAQIVNWSPIVSVNKPPRATWSHLGLYYKKGLRDFVYFYDEPTTQWIKSTKLWSDVMLGEMV